MGTTNLQTRIILNGQVAPSLRNAFRYAQSQSSQTASKLSKLGSTVSGAVNKVAKVVAVGTVAAATGVAAFAANGLKLASDLTEVQNVVDVSFKKNSAEINRWSQNALDKFGLTELQAKQFNGTMGAMLKSSGLTGQAVVKMSEGLSGLSGDFASFYNISQDDAFMKIRAGIAGETEPLKSLGINMSVANLEAFALSKGIKVSYKNMDQASQTALRYSYLMSVSKDAQGDFARTSGSFANQQRLLKARFDQLSATVMKKMIPVLSLLMLKGNNLIKSVANNPQKMKAIQDAVTGVAKEVISLGQDAVPYVISLGKFIMNHGPLMKRTIIGIGLAYATWKVGSTVHSAYKFTKLLTGAGGELLRMTGLLTVAENASTRAKIRDIAETIYLKALYAKDTIVRGANVVATWAMTAATTAWTAATTVATTVGSAFGAVIAFITSPIGITILAIGALVAASVWLYKNWDWVSKGIVSVWQNNVIPFFSGIGAWFEGIGNGLVSKANSAAGFMCSAFTKASNGIKSVFGGIGSVFKGVVNTVIRGINFMTGALNKLHIKIPKVGPVGGGSIGFNIPKIPLFARGGIATQPSIFGEAGPEMAIPLKKNERSIALLSQTATMLGVNPLQLSPLEAKPINQISNGGQTIIQVYYNPTFNGNNTSENKSLAKESCNYLVDNLSGKIRQFGADEVRVSYE